MSAGGMSELDLLAAALAARRDAAKADCECKLATYQADLAEAVRNKQPLWRKAWAGTREAERLWRNLERITAAFEG